MRVLVSSMNSTPETSVPLRKTGTCKRYAASVGLTKYPRAALSENVDLQVLLYLSTKDLVRIYASGMPEGTTRSLNKFFIIDDCSVYQ